jgi:hypothetical protein
MDRRRVKQLSASPIVNSSSGYHSADENHYNMNNDNMDDIDEMLSVANATVISVDQNDVEHKQSNVYIKQATTLTRCDVRNYENTTGKECKWWHIRIVVVEEPLACKAQLMRTIAANMFGPATKQAVGNKDDHANYINDPVYAVERKVLPIKRLNVSNENYQWAMLSIANYLLFMCSIKLQFDNTTKIYLLTWTIAK